SRKYLCHSHKNLLSAKITVLFMSQEGKMIDARIIQALTSSDADKRKKAVAYLAKSLDRDALPHLARVSASDKDPQIRELAKKATAYIEKNAPQPEPAYDDDESYDDEPVYADDDDDDDVYAKSSPSRYSSLYDDDDDDDTDEEADDDEIDVPLPADIQVSAVAEERAKSYVNQAIDWSERGNSGKAVDMLKQGFKLNPHLFYESYSMGVAQNITGMTKGDTQRLLMPSERDLKRMGKDSKSAKEPAKLNIFQQFFALVIFLGATATLISFFAMPWIDFSDLPIVPDPSFPEAQTLGQQVDATQALFDAQFAPLEGMINQIGGETAALLRRFMDALRSVRVTTTGMDVMLLVIGAQNALDAFGFSGIYDVLFDVIENPLMRDTIIESSREYITNLGLDPNNTSPEQLGVAIRGALDATKYVATSPDYSVIAVPVVASIAFLLGLLLFMNPSNSIWVLNILIGLVGVGACAYFYTTGFDLMLRGDANSATSVSIMAGGNVSLPEDMSFIGIGFWVSMGGMIAVAIAPFLGLLFAPAKKTE
ncbi:MAG: hypothetical protein SH821_01375, partial [Phototrophicales bacterium]|nr:hypothetical protein [Phototrophicales bacterium]